MKKLELKNLKVVKLTNEEKVAVKGGQEQKVTETSQQDPRTHPYISWCNSCAG